MTYGRSQSELLMRLLPTLRLLAVVPAVLVAAFLLLYYSQEGSQTGFVDFAIFHRSAEAVSNGEPLYQCAQQWKSLDYTWWDPQGQPDCGWIYMYPAFFAQALVPATALSVSTGGYLWFAASAAGLAGAGFLLISLLIGGPLPRRLIYLSYFMALVLTLHPVRQGLQFGQTDALLLLLVSGSFFAFAQRRDRVSALTIALAIAVKPFLAFLVLYYLWKRAYSLVALTAGVSGALIVVPALIVGNGALFDWIEMSRYFSSPTGAVNPGNTSVHGMLLRLFTENVFTKPLVDAPWLVPVLYYGSAALVVFGLTRVLNRSRDLTRNRLGLEFGLVVVAMLLVSPFAEDLHLVYLVIPLTAIVAVVLRDPFEVRSLALFGGAGAVWAYLSAPRLYDAKYMFFEFRDGPVAAPESLISGVHLYPMLFLGAVVLASLWWFERAAISRPLRRVESERAPARAPELAARRS